ncbi:MAG: hypothetical protein EAZ42_08695 [Verrucomicrobia bacterium]|nr:MAG: hypothetical protein EAZ42_08695 [Verrucomicrobiota bacterium]
MVRYFHLALIFWSLSLSHLPAASWVQKILLCPPNIAKAIRDNLEQQKISAEQFEQTLNQLISSNQVVVVDDLQKNIEPANAESSDSKPYSNKKNYPAAKADWDIEADLAASRHSDQPLAVLNESTFVSLMSADGKTSIYDFAITSESINGFGKWALVHSAAISLGEIMVLRRWDEDPTSNSTGPGHLGFIMEGFLFEAASKLGPNIKELPDEKITAAYETRSDILKFRVSTTVNSQNVTTISSGNSKSPSFKIEPFSNSLTYQIDFKTNFSLDQKFVDLDLSMNIYAADEAANVRAYTIEGAVFGEIGSWLSFRATSGELLYCRLRPDPQTAAPLERAPTELPTERDAALDSEERSLVAYRAVLGLARMLEPSKTIENQRPLMSILKDRGVTMNFGMRVTPHGEYLIVTADAAGHTTLKNLLEKENLLWKEPAP